AEGLDLPGRRSEPLELEGTGVHAEAMSDTCVDEAKDARHRPLRTAAQTQRFEKLGERPLVLGPSLDRDDVGLRVAQGLCGLDEGPWVGRANTRHDLGARREREMSDGATRRLFAAMNE